MNDDASIEHDGEELYVIFGGVRVARRGHPGTPQAGTWIALVSGYTVTDIAPYPSGGIAVDVAGRADGERVH